MKGFSPDTAAYELQRIISSSDTQAQPSEANRSSGLGV